MILGLLLTILGLMLGLMTLMISMFIHFHGRVEKIDSRLNHLEKDILWIKFQHGHNPKEAKEKL